MNRRSCFGAHTISIQLNEPLQVYISAEHEKGQQGHNSPGVYSTQATAATDLQARSFKSLYLFACVYRSHDRSSQVSFQAASQFWQVNSTCLRLWDQHSSVQVWQPEPWTWNVLCVSCTQREQNGDLIVSLSWCLAGGYGMEWLQLGQSGQAQRPRLQRSRSRSCGILIPMCFLVVRLGNRI